jgi:hypothetical protein
VRRALAVIFALAVIGCDSGRQPGSDEKPRPESALVARQSTPPSQPPVTENRRTSPDVPTHPVAPDRVLLEPARAAKTPEQEVPRRHDVSDPGVMGAARAIEIAEKFVRDNGYTDHVPPDSSKLTAESIEWEERNDWIAGRHNTLRPRARGYLKRGHNQSSGWLVGFDYFEPSGRGHGRAVTMDEHGGSLRVEHKDLELKNLMPRPDDESK